MERGSIVRWNKYLCICTGDAGVEHPDLNRFLVLANTVSYEARIQSGEDLPTRPEWVSNIILGENEVEFVE